MDWRFHKALLTYSIFIKTLTYFCTFSSTYAEGKNLEGRLLFIVISTSAWTNLSLLEYFRSSNVLDFFEFATYLKQLNINNHGKASYPKMQQHDMTRVKVVPRLCDQGCH